jgi:ribosome-associated protein
MARQPLESADLTPWCAVRFDRAAGPGGQNVNKVNTRATLWFDFEACPLLPADDKTRVRQHLTTRLARDGRLRVVSQQQRTQAGNRTAAEQRLIELLTAALHVSQPRRPTHPTAGSQRRRVETKRRRGEAKQLRQRPPPASE